MARRTPASLATPALLAAALALALGASPALAASSASSASSQGSSASVGSVSDSFGASSDSSSKDDAKVAAGDYRLVEVAAAAQPGKLRLVLEGTAGAQGRFVLVVPEATVQQAALALGDTVTARARSFGWEFAAAATKQPFFLAVHDAQMREFATRKIAL
jgi:hypothetical protein